MKITLLTILLLVLGVLSCKTNSSSQTPLAKTGMFKVAILYPNGDGKTFDMDYYEKKHMPMVAGFLGNVLRFYEIDKGMHGRTPSDKTPFLAAGYFYVTDLAEYTKAIAQHREAIVGDFKNYTNVQPELFTSEIRQVQNMNIN